MNSRGRKEASAAVPPSRHTKRRQRMRDALLHAGGQLFAAKPVEAVTIDEIVEAADVAKGSFYNHFENKEALAAAILELIHGDLEFHIFAANRDVKSPVARMVRALCVTLRYGLEHPERVPALRGLASRGQSISAPLNAGLVADLQEGLERGAFAHFELETGVMIVLGTVFEAARNVVKFPDKAPAIALDMGTAILRALGVRQALASKHAQAAVAEILMTESVIPGKRS